MSDTSDYIPSDLEPDSSGDEASNLSADDHDIAEILTTPPVVSRRRRKPPPPKEKRKPEPSAILTPSLQDSDPDVVDPPSDVTICQDMKRYLLAQGSQRQQQPENDFSSSHIIPCVYHASIAGVSGHPSLSATRAPSKFNTFITYYGSMLSSTAEFIRQGYTYPQPLGYLQSLTLTHADDASHHGTTAKSCGWDTPQLDNPENPMVQSLQLGPELQRSPHVPNHVISPEVMESARWGASHGVYSTPFLASGVDPLYEDTEFPAIRETNHKLKYYLTAHIKDGLYMPPQTAPTSPLLSMLAYQLYRIYLDPALSSALVQYVIYATTVDDLSKSIWGLSDSKMYDITAKHLIPGRLVCPRVSQLMARREEYTTSMIAWSLLSYCGFDNSLFLLDQYAHGVVDQVNMMMDDNNASGDDDKTVIRFGQHQHPVTLVEPTLFDANRPHIEPPSLDDFIQPYTCLNSLFTTSPFSSSLHPDGTPWIQHFLASDSKDTNTSSTQRLNYDLLLSPNPISDQLGAIFGFLQQPAPTTHPSQSSSFHSRGGMPSNGLQPSDIQALNPLILPHPSSWWLYRAALSREKLVLELDRMITFAKQYAHTIHVLPVDSEMLSSGSDASSAAPTPPFTCQYHPTVEMIPQSSTTPWTSSTSDHSSSMLRLCPPCEICSHDWWMYVYDHHMKPCLQSVNISNSHSHPQLQSTNRRGTLRTSGILPFSPAIPFSPRLIYLICLLTKNIPLSVLRDYFSIVHYVAPHHVPPTNGLNPIMASSNTSSHSSQCSSCGVPLCDPDINNPLTHTTGRSDLRIHQNSLQRHHGHLPLHLQQHNRLIPSANMNFTQNMSSPCLVCGHSAFLRPSASDLFTEKGSSLTKTSVSKNTTPAKATATKKRGRPRSNTKATTMSHGDDSDDDIIDTTSAVAPATIARRGRATRAQSDEPLIEFQLQRRSRRLEARTLEMDSVEVLLSPPPTNKKQPDDADDLPSIGNTPTPLSPVGGGLENQRRSSRSMRPTAPPSLPAQKPALLTTRTTRSQKTPPKSKPTQSTNILQFFTKSQRSSDHKGPLPPPPSFPSQVLPDPHVLSDNTATVHPHAGPTWLPPTTVYSPIPALSLHHRNLVESHVVLVLSRLPCVFHQLQPHPTNDGHSSVKPSGQPQHQHQQQSDLCTYSLSRKQTVLLDFNYTICQPLSVASIIASCGFIHQRALPMQTYENAISHAFIEDTPAPRFSPAVEHFLAMHRYIVFGHDHATSDADLQHLPYILTQKQLDPRTHVLPSWVPSKWCGATMNLWQGLPLQPLLQHTQDYQPAFMYTVSPFGDSNDADPVEDTAPGISGSSTDAGKKTPSKKSTASASKGKSTKSTSAIDSFPLSFINHLHVQALAPSEPGKVIDVIPMYLPLALSLCQNIISLMPSELTPADSSVCGDGNNTSQNLSFTYFGKNQYKLITTTSLFTILSVLVKRRRTVYRKDGTLDFTPPSSNLPFQTPYSSQGLHPFDIPHDTPSADSDTSPIQILDVAPSRKPRSSIYDIVPLTKPTVAHHSPDGLTEPKDYTDESSIALTSAASTGLLSLNLLERFVLFVGASPLLNHLMCEVVSSGVKPLTTSISLLTDLPPGISPPNLSSTLVQHLPSNHYSIYRTYRYQQEVFPQDTVVALLKYWQVFNGSSQPPYELHQHRPSGTTHLFGMGILHYLHKANNLLLLRQQIHRQAIQLYDKLLHCLLSSSAASGRNGLDIDTIKQLMSEQLTLSKKFGHATTLIKHHIITSNSQLVLGGFPAMLSSQHRPNQNSILDHGNDTDQHQSTDGILIDSPFGMYAVHPADVLDYHLEESVLTSLTYELTFNTMLPYLRTFPTSPSRRSGGLVASRTALHPNIPVPQDVLVEVPPTQDKQFISFSDPDTHSNLVNVRDTSTGEQPTPPTVLKPYMSTAYLQHGAYCSCQATHTHTTISDTNECTDPILSTFDYPTVSTPTPLSECRCSPHPLTPTVTNVGGLVSHIAWCPSNSTLSLVQPLLSRHHNRHPTSQLFLMGNVHSATHSNKERPTDYQPHPMQLYPLSTSTGRIDNGISDGHGMLPGILPADSAKDMRYLAVAVEYSSTTLHYSSTNDEQSMYTPDEGILDDFWYGGLHRIEDADDDYDNDDHDDDHDIDDPDGLADDIILSDEGNDDVSSFTQSRRLAPIRTTIYGDSALYYDQVIDERLMSVHSSAAFAGDPDTVQLNSTVSLIPDVAHGQDAHHSIDFGPSTHQHGGSSASDTDNRQGDDSTVLPSNAIQIWGVSPVFSSSLPHLPLVLTWDGVDQRTTYMDTDADTSQPTQDCPPAGHLLSMKWVDASLYQQPDQLILLSRLGLDLLQTTIETASKHNHNPQKSPSADVGIDDAILPRLGLLMLTFANGYTYLVSVPHPASLASVYAARMASSNPSYDPDHLSHDQLCLSFPLEKLPRITLPSAFPLVPCAADITLSASNTSYFLQCKLYQEKATVDNFLHIAIGTCSGHLLSYTVPLSTQPSVLLVHDVNVTLRRRQNLRLSPITTLFSPQQRSIFLSALLSPDFPQFYRSQFFCTSSMSVQTSENITHIHIYPHYNIIAFLLGSSTVHITTLNGSHVFSTYDSHHPIVALTWSLNQVEQPDATGAFHSYLSLVVASHSQVISITCSTAMLETFLLATPHYMTTNQMAEYQHGLIDTLVTNTNHGNHGSNGSNSTNTTNTALAPGVDASMLSRAISPLSRTFLSVTPLQSVLASDVQSILPITMADSESLFERVVPQTRLSQHQTSSHHDRHGWPLLASPCTMMSFAPLSYGVLTGSPVSSIVESSVNAKTKRPVWQWAVYAPPGDAITDLFSQPIISLTDYTTYASILGIVSIPNNRLYLYSTMDVSCIEMALQCNTHRNIPNMSKGSRYLLSHDIKQYVGLKLRVLNQLLSPIHGKRSMLSVEVGSPHGSGNTTDSYQLDVAVLSVFMFYYQTCAESHFPYFTKPLSSRKEGRLLRKKGRRELLKSTQIDQGRTVNLVKSYRNVFATHTNLQHCIQAVINKATQCQLRFTLRPMYSVEVDAIDFVSTSLSTKSQISAILSNCDRLQHTTPVLTESVKADGVNYAIETSNISSTSATSTESLPHQYDEDEHGEHGVHYGFHRGSFHDLSTPFKSLAFTQSTEALTTSVIRLCVPDVTAAASPIPVATVFGSQTLVISYDGL